MILNVAHLVMHGEILVLSSIGLCLMLERSLARFLVVEALKLSRMVILTFTAFCFLKKKNSRYSETKRENPESKKKGS